MNSNNQKIIQSILGITEESYNMEIFEYAYVYLDMITGVYPAVGAKLAKSRLFWSWWQRQYEMVDECFLFYFDNNMLSTANHQALLKAYRHMHVKINVVIDKTVYENINDTSKKNKP